MPLQVIITAAKTVSRANDALPGPPPIIKLTISPTSMIVTATASTSDPYGSPTRWATTSAWCTPARTAPASAKATTIWTMTARSRPQVSASKTTARIGTSTVHDRSLGRRLVAMGPGFHRGVGRTDKEAHETVRVCR